MTNDSPRPVSVALIGGVRHSGTLTRRTHVTLVGGMDIDLSAAEIPPEGVTITKVSLVGGVSLIVPADARVEVSGFVLVGGRDVERGNASGPGAPVVRVRAFGLAGGVKVRVA